MWRNAKTDREFTPNHTKKVWSRNAKRVAQKSLDGDILEVFESMNEAERKTGINHAIISEICRGKYIKPMRCNFTFEIIE